MTEDITLADASRRTPTGVWVNRPRPGGGRTGRAARAIAGVALAAGVLAVAAANSGDAAAPTGSAAAYLPAQVAIDPLATVEPQPPTF